MSSFPYLPPGTVTPQRVNAGDEYARDPFFYTAERLPLAANASESFQIQIQADSDFLLAELTGVVKDLDANETAIVNPAILIEILSSASGRILMDRAVAWSALVGTAERPYILPAPKTFPANSQITINFTNQTAATKRVRLTLHGYKLFANVGGAY